MLLQDRRIFIVEDNLSNRIVFQKALHRHGANVIFERWGRNALFSLHSAAPVDMVLLDLMLADGVSGFDIYDELRGVPEFNAVPIVAVSAMDAAVAIPKVRSRGFAAFIAKPIDNQRFPQQLATILSGAKVWDPGERAIS